MSVNRNPLGYTGRVIAKSQVAGLAQYATASQAQGAFRDDRGLSCANGAFLMGNPQRMFDACNVNPVSAAKAGGAATGTAGDINVMQTGANFYEYSPKGTQTILAPSLGAAGINVNMDQTDNDGVEIVLGSNSTIGRYAFTMGSSDQIEFRLKFSIEDVSGTDDCAVGFRKVQAYQANVDDYTDMAVLNVISGNIFIETILNNGATTSVDTTLNWADLATHELKVVVNANRKVYFYIDDALPPVTSAFTFDSGDVIVPFFFFLNASDVAGAVQWQEVEAGRVLKG